MEIKTFEQLRDDWENAPYPVESKRWVVVDEIKTQIKETIADLKDKLQKCDCALDNLQESDCGFDECPECYGNLMIGYAVDILKGRFKELNEIGGRE